MSFDQIKVELQEFMGSDRRIAEAAWTSSHEHAATLTRTDEDIARLVNMLAESGHGTPFESVVMRFWIRLPIFADRQHMTHRVASHNGLSGRYRTLPEDYYTIPNDVKEIMKRVETVDPTLANHITDNLEFMAEASIAAYRDMIHFSKKAQDSGIITNDEFKRIREIARGVMPVAGMVERVSIFNLRSFCNYMRHRLSPHAQPEIRDVATKMLEEVKKAKVCPVAIEAMEKREWLIEPDFPS